MNWSSAMRAMGVRSFQLNGMPVCSGVVKRFESVMMIAWLRSSPRFSLICRKPSAPAPPDLFTTTMGRGVSLCFSAMPWMRRAIWSAPPPVPAGTTNSICLVGSHAAAAGATVIARIPTTPMRSLMPHSLVVRRRSMRRGPDPIMGPGPSPLEMGHVRRACALLGLERRLRRVEPAERNDRRDLPLLPHLVDLALEVREVFLGEVREAPLLQQVLSDGLALAAFHDGLGLSVVLHLPVLDLVEREESGLDGELAHLVREHRVVVPAL